MSRGITQSQRRICIVRNASRLEGFLQKERFDQKASSLRNKLEKQEEEAGEARGREAGNTAPYSNKSRVS